MLTLNALMAADAVLIPVQCQFFARGLYELLETIDSIRDEDTHPNLQILEFCQQWQSALTTQMHLKPSTLNYLASKFSSRS